MVHVPEMAVVL